MNEIGKMIGQGNTSQIYNYGADCILKLYREGLPEYLCENEFSNTQFAYQLNINVPEPIEIIHVEGRIGAIYKKLIGRTMLKHMLNKPWRISHYATCLSAYHGDIQKTFDDKLVTVKEKLTQDIKQVSLLSESEKQIIYRYMAHLPDGNTLCHFDFHPDNIMLLGNQYSVIDWMTACKGDKLADVARTGIILKFSQIPRVPTIVNFFVSLFQRSVHKKYIANYLEMTNERIDNIRKWELAVAAARLVEWIPEKEKHNLLSFVKSRIEEIED